MCQWPILHPVSLHCSSPKAGKATTAWKLPCTLFLPLDTPAPASTYCLVNKMIKSIKWVDYFFYRMPNVNKEFFLFFCYREQKVIFIIVKTEYSISQMSHWYGWWYHFCCLLFNKLELSVCEVDSECIPSILTFWLYQLIMFHLQKCKSSNWYL